MIGTEYPEPPDWQLDPNGTPPAAPSWGRVDLSAHLDGTYRPPSPTLMPRADGRCLLYPGLVHSIHGESESGKSWIAQAEAARLLKAGEPVLYLDFESDAGSVVGRLLELGVPRAQILTLFDYRRPGANPAMLHEITAWADLMATRPTLAVIDGVTDALGIWGAKSIDNDQVSEWLRRFPKPLAEATGAAVLMIDHVTKNGGTRGRFAIGGQAKMAGLTGAAYTVDVVEPFGQGLRGVLQVRVAKDRPGGVRSYARDMRASDRTQLAAIFVLDGTGETLTATLETPPVVASAFRPTVLMEAISRFLEASGDCSKNQIETNVSGKATTIRTGLDVLVAEGFVSREKGARGGLVHRSLASYREDDDPVLLTSSDLVPTSSRTNSINLVPSSQSLQGTR